MKNIIDRILETKNPKILIFIDNTTYNTSDFINILVKKLKNKYGGDFKFSDNPLFENINLYKTFLIEFRKNSWVSANIVSRTDFIFYLNNGRLKVNKTITKSIINVDDEFDIKMILLKYKLNKILDKNKQTT